jgi:hypothetical protein
VDDGYGPNVNAVEILGPVDLLNVPRGRLWGGPTFSYISNTQYSPGGTDGGLRGLNAFGVPELHRAHPCMVSAFATLFGIRRVGGGSTALANRCCAGAVMLAYPCRVTDYHAISRLFRDGWYL